jgi:hypothetical protein
MKPKRISRNGVLPALWSVWFDGFSIWYEAGENTTLPGNSWWISLRSAA